MFVSPSIYLTKMRHILGFNSFSVHFEMYGYLIHYCKERNYSLTIYCHFHNQNGFFDFYQKTFNYPLLKFKNIWGELEKEINDADAIVLFTDDDPNYNVYHSKILHRSLMIEHTIFRRRNDIPHILSTRPFDFSLLKEAKILSKYNNYTTPSSPNWALPTYPVLLPSEKTRLADLPRQTTVCILGGNKEYKIDLIHRLKPLKNTDSKIKIIAISRDMELCKFDALDKENFEVTIYKHIPFHELVDILKKVDFLLTDVSKDNEYNVEKILMSGCLPLAFSLLIPLIISKQTNQYYQFQNVIEFDKSTQSPIFLEYIDPSKIHQECLKLSNRNMALFDEMFRTIFMTNPLIP